MMLYVDMRKSMYSVDLEAGRPEYIILGPGSAGMWLYIILTAETLTNSAEGLCAVKGFGTWIQKEFNVVFKTEDSRCRAARYHQSQGCEL